VGAFSPETFADLRMNIIRDMSHSEFKTHLSSRLVIAIAILALVSASFIASLSTEQATIHASVIELVMSPRKYAKKRVRVEGYFIHEPNRNYDPPEDQGVLYRTKELADHKSEDNAVLLRSFAAELRKNRALDRFDRKHVVVEGTFKRYLDGTRFSSGIDVDRIESLEVESSHSH
jgi:hypothetical protein